MSLAATRIDLLKDCPRNIKRRLPRDILLILFVTFGAILTIILVQRIKTENDISTALINDSSHLVKKRFQSVTSPLNNTMMLLAKWGELNLLRLDDPELLGRQFKALMGIHSDISAIALADTESNEVILSHHKKQWFLYEERERRTISSILNNGKIINSEEKRENRANQAPSLWVQGAMASTTPAGSLFLTAPSPLKGSEETGIIASLRWSRRDSPDNSFISVFSFTIKDLMLFMEDLEITENGHLLLLQKNGTLLSSIRDSSLQPSATLPLATQKNIPFFKKYSQEPPCPDRNINT